MKKIVPLLFFLALFSSDICFSQSGWFWQNPWPSYNSYEDVKFASSFVGCAVGSNGTIVRTTDRGVSWKIVKESYYTSDTLFSTCFVNQTTGFAVGRKVIDGLICKTTNSGANWVEYNTNRVTTLRSVYFTNENTGYTVGFYSVILKTTNSGLTWDTLQRSTQGNYLNIFFVNDNTGFIGSQGFMLKTVNAGLNWSNVNINLTSGDLNSIYFIDQSTGFTCYGWHAPPWYSGTSIFKTTNCGLTWNSQNINDKESGGSIRFADSFTGYICGNSYFLKTTNCGISWFSTGNYSWDDINAIDFQADSVAYAVGEYGNIFKGNILSDSFANVSSINHHQNFSITFVDQFTGYIAGNDGILKTTNGGNSWLRQNCPSLLYRDVNFSDINNGFACSSQNIIKTTNGGENWSQLSFVSEYACFCIYALNKDTVFIKRNGSVIRTIDGGNNWVSTQLSGGDICFINSRTGFISGVGSNSLAKTTNVGDNWFFITLDIEAAPSKIQKIDSLNLFASAWWTGYVSGVIKSSNGGANWSRYGISSDYSGYSFFINPDIGYFITTGNYNSGNCRVWGTTNGGFNWSEQILPFQENRYLSGIKFVNEQTGFIIGYCSILKTTNGGIPIGINPINSEIPNNFSLSQNYPNPFNPITKIKYDIPPSKGAGGMIVQLIIYDVLGRQIEIIVNKTQKPGSYEVQWDGSRYASGVYFYKLMTEEWTETKKMVLIK